MINFYTDQGVRLHTPLVWQSFFMQFLPEVVVNYVKADEILSENPQIIIFPGGTAHSFAETLGPEGLEKIRQWVHDGGTFLGVCAGAYLATETYDWSLGIAPLQVQKPWKRGEMLATIKIHSEKLVAEAEYWNGPIMDPTASLQFLAVFVEPFAGHPAVTFNRYGSGKVFLTVPHLERSPECKSFLADTIRDMLVDK